MERLTGRVALVTGAAGGIGSATAVRLAAEGAAVLVTDVADAQSIVDTIVASGGIAAYVRHDVTSESEWSAAVSAAVDQFGSLNILVNNAGLTRDGLSMRMSEADWDLMIRTHVKGVFLCTKAVLPQMCERREGVIVTTGSDYSVRGKADGAAYAAAKTAIYSLTKSLALEFAPFGIRCNSVGPGPIETPMLLAGRSEEEWAPIRTVRAAQVPMGRLGQPEEVASVVDFLLSDRSSYITGQIIHPNGAQISW
jgi:3-oxoacyl-[acyl-carrier protein] reductase